MTPGIAAAQRVAIDPEIAALFSFHDRAGTYVFTQRSSRWLDHGAYEWVNRNAASWWAIKSDPATGLEALQKDVKMSSANQFVTPFTLESQPYIFGLHERGVNIWRIEPQSGLKLVMEEGQMSPHYRHVVSFQRCGRPYILGLHEDVGANIWSIESAPSDRVSFHLLTPPESRIPMSHHYEHLTMFYAYNRPHIFGLHRDQGAWIWRVRDDPAQGLDLVTHGAAFPHSYNYVLPFHLNGRAYLAGLVSANYMDALADAPALPAGGPEMFPGTEFIFEILEETLELTVEWGKGYGCIWSIEGPPDALSLKKISKTFPISHEYSRMTTFEQGGSAYIFGVHKENYANIWKICDEPSNGFSLSYYGKTGRNVSKQPT